MALDSFNVYHSYLKALEPLNDAECGRLLKACLQYSMTGVVPELRGNERFLFPSWQSQIDRDRAKYDAKCKRNSQNASMRWDATACERMRNDAKHAKDKDKDKDKDNSPIPPTPLAPFPGASPELCDAFAAWLSYKKERREAYKSTGLQALMSRIQTAAGQYGDHAVAELVRDCMAASWKGIIFDRLKNAPPPSRQQRASWADLAAQMDAEEAYQ